MKKKTIILYLILYIILITSCKSINTQTNTIIEDLIDINQDHKSYIQNKESTKLLIPKTYQSIQNKKFIQNFLSPWNLTQPQTTKIELIKGFKTLENDNLFAENKQQISKKWVEKIKKNANLTTFPNYKKKAITISNTNLRLIPTLKPAFSKFSDNSNGFPFDNLQNSELPANTPIFITHITKDNAWVYVNSSFASGWVPIRDIAYTGPKFIKEFKKYQHYVAPVIDDVSIKTINGTYLYQGFIGMSFPLYKNQKYHYIIITARANQSRYAYIAKSKLTKKHAKQKPIPLSSKNVAQLCNNLIDQPYGWGGLFNNRDCSAMIRDLFSPFSLWLPRNSKAQAKNGGTYIDVSFMSQEDKEKFIIDNAIPYATLLWFPGHIMLYIGQQNNKSLIFHNIWGLRTNDKLKRKIIGKAVITTLKPGEELNNVDKSYNFLNRIEGMTLLTHRY